MFAFIRHNRRTKLVVKLTRLLFPFSAHWEQQRSWWW